MTTDQLDILKWYTTAEVRETPAPGREPAQPGEYDDDDDSDEDEDEEDSENNDGTS